MPAVCYPNLSVNSFSARRHSVVEPHGDAVILRLISGRRHKSPHVCPSAGAHRRSRKSLACHPPALLVIAGNAHFFSAGADLNEIAALTGVRSLSLRSAGSAIDECGRPVPRSHHRRDSRLLHGRRAGLGVGLRSPHRRQRTHCLDIAAPRSGSSPAGEARSVCPG